MRVILTEMGAMTAKTHSLPGDTFVGTALGSWLKENDTLAVSYPCTGCPETVVVLSVLVSCTDLTPDSFDL